MLNSNTNPVNTPFETNIRPGWMGDFASRLAILAGGAKIDAASFPGEEAVPIRVTANAAADAVAVIVAPLSDALPAGIILPFGGKKYATLTAAAIRGATSLTVSPLVTALAVDDASSYSAPGLARRVASGRLVGCTYAELENGAASGMNWGKAEDADEVVRLIAYDVPDANKDNDCNIYRPGNLVYVNFLPGWADLSATLKTKVRAAYECTVGAPGQEVPAQ